MVSVGAFALNLSRILAKALAGAVGLGLVLSFSGCSAEEELLGGTSVQQAIEIVVSLKNSGVPAEMKKSSRGRNESYSVYVSPSDRSTALRVLNDLHLPRKEDDSFAALTTGEGFVPNLRETANLRLDRALALEVERVLMGFEGVADVKVIIRSHLVVPENFESPASPASATVVLRYVSRSGNQPFGVDDVKKLVLKAVPGAKSETVEVNLVRVFPPGLGGEGGSTAGLDPKNNVVPLAPVSPFPFLVPASDRRRVLSIVSALLGGFALTGIIIGWSLSSLLRKPVKRPPQKAVRTAVLEASYKGGTDPAIQNQRPPNLPPKG